MGSAGLITGIAQLSQGTGPHIFVGILMVIVGIGFGAAGLADFFMLTKVRMIR